MDEISTLKAKIEELKEENSMMKDEIYLLERDKEELEDYSKQLEEVISYAYRAIRN